MNTIATHIVNQIVHSPRHCVVLRNRKGAKLLTLSYDKVGYRYFHGRKPGGGGGGGGRKHTRCSRSDAIKLVASILAKVLPEYMTQNFTLMRENRSVYFRIRRANPHIPAWQVLDYVRPWDSIGEVVPWYNHSGV